MSASVISGIVDLEESEGISSCQYITGEGSSLRIGGYARRNRPEILGEIGEKG